METYLAIITTVLVLTQIIRLIQNWIQLRKFKDVHINNMKILTVYMKLEDWLDRQEDMPLEGAESHRDDIEWTSA